MRKWNLRGQIVLCMLLVLTMGGCAGQNPHQKDYPLEPRADANPEAAQYFLEGNHLFGKRELRKAAKKYEAAITAQPSSGEAHYNLGLALHHQGLYTKSRPHFMKAAKLEPLNPVIRNAPPFRQYGSVESEYEEHTTDGHVGHSH